MIRKLAMAMVVSGALGSSYANALGLGEIKLNSALNQPLDAEVKLLNVGDLSKNEILPNLASHDDFARAGVERVFFLTGIKFDVQLDGKGGAVLHLTTDRIVREPFLNFLIELHWPSGRLLREYTALLDPPLFSEAPPVPVQQSVTVAPIQPKVEPAPQQQKPQKQSYSAPSVSQTITQPAPSQVTSEQRDGTVRVKKNDTLWGIAKENRPDRSVTVRQTMVAIQQHNPHAFIKNNINLLKSGQILRIPEVEEIRRVSSREAYAETARQNEEWKSKKTIDATQKYSPPTSKPSTKDEGGLVKLIATEEEADSKPETESSATGVAATSNTDGGSTGGDGSGPGTSTSQDVEAIQKQLDDLQRLLTLKQEQLALLQAKKAEEQADAGSAVAVTEDGVDPAGETAVVSAVETAPDSEQVESSTTTAAVESEADKVSATEQVAAEVTPVVTEEKPSVEKAAAEQPRPKEGIVDILLNNPLYIGVLVVVILGALLLLGAISRRRKEENEYAAAELQNEIDTPVNNVEIPDDLSDELAEVDDASSTNLADAEPILSDEGSEGSADNTRKLLDESDIFIAYGRYERAIEILQPAVNAEPENTELRLKLAETYLLNNDEARFSQQEADLQAIGDASALGALDELKAKYSATLEASDQIEETVVSSDQAAESKDDFLADENVLQESTTDEEALSFDIDEALDTDQQPAELADLEFELPEEETLSEHTSVEEESHDNLVDFETSADDNFLDVEEEGGSSSQELEFDLEEDAPVKSEADSINADDLDFLVDTDESATKLELAKAYIDMADAEAAQEILNEVLTDGSDEQQQEARKLLDNLG